MRTTLTALEKRAPLAHTLRVTNEEIESTDIEKLLAAQGLFYSKRIVVFDNVLKEKNAQKILLPYMEVLARSEHVFLVLEEELSADLKKQLVAHATKAIISDEGEKQAKSGPDWAVTNALEKKDSKGLWLAIVRSLLEGAPPEQVHGQLFWKAKQILLAGRLHIWSHDSIRKLIAELAELPHEARRRGMEMKYALERFALTIQ
ncbi:hypothetical protein HY413_00905 [Candidatus Kaiserbacteria bacterium]|nr:hypothetical protein [Candidatus Kaiserbacteria bacterium]